MIFSTLNSINSDSILGLMAEFQADPSMHKIDLTVGVYKDNLGNTPVMDAVRVAERRIIDKQVSKKYLPPLGIPGFREGVRKLVLGDLDAAIGERVAVLQTPGGCGALRVGAELFRRANDDGEAYLSAPTWGNHHALFGDAGLNIKQYPYYQFLQHQLAVDEMLSVLEKAPSGSLVVIQACCHNPTGADLNEQQFDALLDVLERRALVPFFDMAYLGLGDSIEEDARPLRKALSRLPEVLVAVSFSKNFGLYRERTGALLVLSSTEKQTQAVQDNVKQIARGMYSMPPANGALIVDEILSDSDLTQQWNNELAQMAQRLKSAREQLVKALNEENTELQFDWLGQQKGMFSLLGLSKAQVISLKEEHHIYMVGDSRINIAGLDETNIPVLARAVAPLLVNGD